MHDPWHGVCGMLQANSAGHAVGSRIPRINGRTQTAHKMLLHLIEERTILVIITFGSHNLLFAVSDLKQLARVVIA